jgi:hypothetical protein
MSDEAPAKKRSRRSPAASSGTTATRDPAEECVPESITTSDVTIENAPVDPKSTSTYRLARAAAIGLGVMIVLAIVVMIYGLANGWNRNAASQPAAAATRPPVSMTLAPGFRILSSDTQPGRLILHVRSETLDEIDIIDLNDGHLISQIHAEPPR